VTVKSGRFGGGRACHGASDRVAHSPIYYAGGLQGLRRGMLANTLARLAECSVPLRGLSEWKGILALCPYSCVPHTGMVLLMCVLAEEGKAAQAEKAMEEILQWYGALEDYY